MRKSRRKSLRRRGVVVALSALSLSVLLGFVALSVDVGMLYNVKTELQRGADAGALAGAAELMSDARIKAVEGNSSAWTTALYSARSKASSYGSANKVQYKTLTIDANTANSSTGDIVIGQLINPDTLNEQISFPSATTNFNTVQVKMRKNKTRNGQVSLWFGKIFGVQSTGLEASAAATLDQRVVGFKIKGSNGVNPAILPFSLHVNAWNNLVAGGSGTSDSYSYNSGAVAAGSDGIRELNMYPGAGTSGNGNSNGNGNGNSGSSGGGQFPQLGPGNFGTVDIGSPNNSTADLSRQILYGPNASDLAYLGGELKLNSSGYLMLNGDTGLSAGVKDELAAIIGKPRVIPIFDQVTGNGNNAMYRIVGFAGIRIVHVDLTGSMSSKQVIIQPAAISDPTAITSASYTGGPNRFVYAPLKLTR